MYLESLNLRCFSGADSAVNSIHAADVSKIWWTVAVGIFALYEHKTRSSRRSSSRGSASADELGSLNVAILLDGLDGVFEVARSRRAHNP